MYYGNGLPDMGFIFYLAMFGLVCAALAIIGGVGFAAWFIFTHVQIVW